MSLLGESIWVFCTRAGDPHHRPNVPSSTLPCHRCGAMCNVAQTSVSIMSRNPLARVVCLECAVPLVPDLAKHGTTLMLDEPEQVEELQRLTGETPRDIVAGTILEALARKGRA